MPLIPATIRPILACALLGCAVSSVAQDALPDRIGAPRMRAIALSTEPPGPLSLPYTQLLDNVADAVTLGSLDLAHERFANFLTRQRDAGRKAVPEGYIDYILRRVAMAESEDAARAAQQIDFYFPQENAVLEHLSELEKHLSFREGSRLPDFILREPVLSDFGTDDEPVQRGLPKLVNTDALPEMIAFWRQTLETLSSERADAVRDFDEAVRSEPGLLAKLTAAQRELHLTVRETFPNPGT